MLEKKTQGFVLPKMTREWRGLGGRVLMGTITAGVLAVAANGAMAQTAQTTQVPPTAQTPSQAPLPKKSKIGPAAPVTYDNKYEIFGGLNFQTFQAGQDLPKRMNMGGGEVLATYWVTPKVGPGVEWRGDWGTTPVKPNIQFNGRAGASLNGVLAGLQYRGPKNQYAALNYHAYFGASYGKFDYTVSNPTVLGMYTNRMKPLAALGGSVDINRSKNWAIRLSPDLILEHFGSETREFFAISGGVVYRIGKR